MEELQQTIENLNEKYPDFTIPFYIKYYYMFKNNSFRTKHDFSRDFQSFIKYELSDKTEKYLLSYEDISNYMIKATDLSKIILSHCYEKEPEKFYKLKQMAEDFLYEYNHGRIREILDDPYSMEKEMVFFMGFIKNIRNFKLSDFNGFEELKERIIRVFEDANDAAVLIMERTAAVEEAQKKLKIKGMSV